MAAWDHTSFGNDDACDWANDLSSYEDLSLVEETLDAVVNIGEEYLPAVEAAEAIAAAEVVARLQSPPDSTDADGEAIDIWVAAHPIDVPYALAEKARDALDRILSNSSELATLWEDSEPEAFEAWTTAVSDLKARIMA